MKHYEKPRAAASQAVIDLRDAMGFNQAEFAIKILGSAVTTMSRYETTHPPKHEQLLKFLSIADKHAQTESDPAKRAILSGLSIRFRALYMFEAFETIGRKLQENNLKVAKLIEKAAAKWTRELMSRSNKRPTRRG